MNHALSYGTTYDEIKRYLQINLHLQLQICNVKTQVLEDVHVVAEVEIPIWPKGAKSGCVIL